MKREYCTSETFRTDITELCEDCPLIDKIKTGIKNQIEFKILEQQSILIKELFSDYLRKEILDAQNAISETQNIVSRGECTNLAGCIEVYIWNKERIKVLNQFYNEVKTPQQEKAAVLLASGNTITETAKKPPEKKELTFKDLFNDPENAQKIKDILEQNHYTTKGKWQPNKQVYNEHSEMKTELLAVYYVLKEKEVLKVGKTTTQAKIFYKEFGLKVGEYISDRQLRERPNKDINKFENLFKRIE